MKNQLSLRQQRKNAARSMNMLALGGVTVVTAVAAFAMWFSWAKNTSQPVITEVDPMSMIGLNDNHE